ncbi:transcriptional regulator [Photobacterium sanctipauli]|nr:winged helix-turn-helix domain-containing protein [Photobacterium sanctipauli]
MPHTENSQPQDFSLQTLRFSGSDLTVINTVNGAKNQLRVKEAELLKLLCQNYPHVTLRQDLAQTIWAGTYVSDFTINQTVNGLRSKLFDLGKSLIVTVPKRGYKLTTEPLYDKGENQPDLASEGEEDVKPGIHLQSGPEQADISAQQSPDAPSKPNPIRSPWLYITAFVVSALLVFLGHWLIPPTPTSHIGQTTVLFVPDEQELPLVEQAIESEEYIYIDKVKETLYGCHEDKTCTKIAP